MSDCASISSITSHFGENEAPLNLSSSNSDSDGADTIDYTNPPPAAGSESDDNGDSVLPTSCEVCGLIFTERIGSFMMNQVL